MGQRFLKPVFSFLMVFVMCSPLSAQHDSSSVEWIKVYFNMPSDHSFALNNNESSDEHDLIGTLEALIDSAQSSVDLCIYDLEHPRIGQALVRAKQRGLWVRLVTDNYHRHNAHRVDSLMWAMLRKGYVISIDDDGDVYMTDGTIFDNSLVNAGRIIQYREENGGFGSVDELKKIKGIGPKMMAILRPNVVLE